ncbi:MAG: hypothetical protein RID09_11030 [Coleofasciculus sp. G1-WW12-02]|uniref:hypothetical protein n=1 Tax=unclassified Coleofasciculus TaxID=2692782 RepID=UPI0032F9AD32
MSQKPYSIAKETPWQRILDAPVGEALLGRVMDATGRPLDNHGAIEATGLRYITPYAAMSIG